MELMVRRLLRITVNFKNLSFSQVQCIHTPSTLYLSKGNHFKIIKLNLLYLYSFSDDVNQYNLKNLKDDNVLKTIQNLNPTNLLNYIDSNKHQIECKHIMIALSSLHNFYKKQLDASGSYEKIDFTKLCECLKPQFKHLSPTEVIDVLDILQLLNVPSSNLFVVTLLHLIKDFSKELSFQEINKLSISVSKFEPSNLTKEVNNYLEEKFSELILKLDVKDMNELSPAICFAFKNIKDCKSINVLIDSIENFQGELKIEEALVLFNTLSSIKNIPPKLTKIITNLKKILIDNIDKLEYQHVLQIIEDISLQINSK